MDFERLKLAVQQGEDAALPLLLKACERRGLLLQDIATTLLMFFKNAPSDSADPDFLKYSSWRVKQVYIADIRLTSLYHGFGLRGAKETDFRPMLGAEGVGACFCSCKKRQNADYVQYLGPGFKTVSCQRCAFGVLPGQRYTRNRAGQTQTLAVLDVVRDRDRPVLVHNESTDKQSWFSHQGLYRCHLAARARGPVEKIWDPELW